MGLISLIIHSVTQGFAVNGQALILRGMDLIPTLQSPVQFDGIDPNQYIPDNVFAGHDVLAVFITATKTSPGRCAETLGPIGYCPVSPHAAQAGGSGNPQDG